jgi:uncharacterized repeat protein (TIGR01451 family)
MTFVSLVPNLFESSRLSMRNLRIFKSAIRPSWLGVVLLFATTVVPRSAAQIQVDTTTQGVTYGNACSLQEAIYATEFGGNVAIDSTDPDHTYYTGCSDPSGSWNTIVLQNTTYSFNTFWDGDAHNPFGPTATPIIFKKITIQGNGATLQSTATGYWRLFAVGEASIPAISTDVTTPAVSGTGSLTLQNVYIKNFHVKGGDGARGGGGGLGAGGAIYLGKVSTGVATLTIENSTFDSNGATGGNGASAGNGGGGGLGGNGGKDIYPNLAGGGGGGARGNGGDGGTNPCYTFDCSSGGGGGGTVFSGENGEADGNGFSPGVGGFDCGGGGGGPAQDHTGGYITNTDGHDGTCHGGGGGGGAVYTLGLAGGVYGHGGDGMYGGGGGGSAQDAGNGGFGGGGGAGLHDGGIGGFGAGGGTGGASNGTSVAFGGNAGCDSSGCGSGGGGGLGGAIFNDNGTVVIQNSTFVNNAVLHGQSTAGAGPAGDSGGAIFSRNGSLTVQNSTITGGAASGAGGGIVVYADGFPATPIFLLDNTIIANNGPQECIVHGIAQTSIGGTNSASNLIVNNSGCPQATVSADPKLDSLKLNAPGNTPTMALLSGSPAINAADTNTSLSTDQRGVQRKAAPDIGAYETVPHADLNLTMKVSPDTAKAGDTVTYTLSFGNAGPDKANDVTITNNFPSELTYTTCLANAGGSCSSSGATYTSLLANETEVVTISGTLKSGLTRGTVVSNTATIQASSPVDFSTNDNSDSASFTVIVPDFSMSPVSPITIPVGSSGTSSLTVGSVDTFSSAVSLSATGPSNFHKSFSPNPATPPSNGSTTSTLTLTLEPSVTAGTYTMNETGTSGALSHTASVTVNVQTTIAGTKNVINSDLKLGAIDSAGVATALTSKLAVAQSAKDAAQVQTEINVLQALLSELNAQSGKHIKTSWIDGNGQPFNPAAVLIGDVTDLLINAGANLKANPIIGNVVNTSGVGLSGLTVNLLSPKNAVIASATTDATGFYYFPATSGLTSGAAYTAKVSVPKTYKNSTPSSQSFTWKAMAVALNNFVLN